LFGGLAIATAGMGGGLGLRKRGVGAELVYALPGAVLWVGLLDAGIHPVLAGVILGLLTPMKPRRANEPPPAVRVERLLHPWIAFVVMPLFALANAGIRIGGGGLGDPPPRARVSAGPLVLPVRQPPGLG